MSRPFAAAYGGACAADCGDRIHPGDPVTYVADELFHEECAGRGPAAALDAPPGRVCPSCWTVHAGECL